MNDSKEYIWSLELLEKYIETINSDFPVAIYNFVKARQGLGLPFFCSFSTKEDDLNQWRAYSNNGSSVCIEFEVEFNDEIRELPLNDILEGGQFAREASYMINPNSWYL